MVVLYDENEEIIGDVEYNNDLDYWDGHNHTNGGTGRHKGFGQLDSGEFYIIHGTQWQGESNYARLTSPEEIVKEAIRTSNVDMLEKYEELMEIYENKFNKKIIGKH
jgi:hypothetical protein